MRTCVYMLVWLQAIATPFGQQCLSLRLITSSALSCVHSYLELSEDIVMVRKHRDCLTFCLAGVKCHLDREKVCVGRIDIKEEKRKGYILDERLESSIGAGSGIPSTDM